MSDNANVVLLCMAADPSGHSAEHVRQPPREGVMKWSTNHMVRRNWSSTMFAGVLLTAAVYYIFKGRHDYAGPVMTVKRID